MMPVIRACRQLPLLLMMRYKSFIATAKRLISEYKLADYVCQIAVSESTAACVKVGNLAGLYAWQ